MAIWNVTNNSDLAAVAVGSGDTVLFRSNTTFAAASMPASILDADNLTIGVSGSGSKPIISGGVIRADWSFDAGNNVYSRPAYASNTLGNITEDDVPMKYVAWNTNIATTSASMNSGSNGFYWAGSMTYDPVSKLIYIRPSSGVPSAHTYVVSETIHGMSASSTPAKNGVVDGLKFTNISRHGILLYNKKNLLIKNVDLSVIGGFFAGGATYVGNGIEASFGTDGLRVENCSATDIFDSTFTSQLYESSPQTLSGHKYKNISATRYGMHGIEVSVQTAQQFISDISANGIESVDGGLGFSGDRNGAVFTVLSNSVNSSRITRAFASSVNSLRGRRLYLGYGHGGVCGIENATGVGSRFTALGASNGATNQVDLARDVSDSFGPLSGGTTVTASLLKTFEASRAF